MSSAAPAVASRVAASSAVRDASIVGARFEFEFIGVDRSRESTSERASARERYRRW